MPHLDDMLTLLSKDTYITPPAKYFTRSYTILLSISIMLVISLTIAASIGHLLELRSDYWQVISNPIDSPFIILKQLLPALILLAVLCEVRRSIYPENNDFVIRSVIGVMLLLCLPVLVIIALSNSELSQWQGMISGGSLARCLIVIPSLSLIILAAQIWALIHAAPQRPLWLGFQAGLIAGSAATIIYAFYCTEDSPAFFGLWYTLGIVASGAIGMLAGRAFLRW